MAEAGRRLSVTATMIGQLCRKHQIRRPPVGKLPTREWPIQQIRQWVEVEGRTHQWVAEQLGCRNQTVSKLCRKHDIQTQRSGPRSGKGHPDWKGGKIRYGKDLRYVALYCPNHPHARPPQKKYVPAHRLVVEAHLNGLSLRGLLRRYESGDTDGLKALRPEQVVHHKRNYRNRLENLRVYDSNAEHLAETLAGQRPQWTPEGKQRIREAALRRHIRNRLARGAQLSSQTTGPTLEAPGSMAPSP